MWAKKAAILGIGASLLLVAMVVAVVVNETKSHHQASTTTSNKAVHTICSTTDYKETCEKTLSQANTTDPKELIKLTFDATIQNIGAVLKNSTLLKEAALDKSTKDAFDAYDHVLDIAVDDLRNSIVKVNEISETNIAVFVEDLRTWLSAVISDQETCIDAFENTTGDLCEGGIVPRVCRDS